MNLEEEFKTETKLNAMEEMHPDYWVYTNDYVEWLEAKINYTRSCNKLKDKEINDFLEWRIVNKWVKWYDTGLYKKDELYKTKDELYKIYISEQNL